MNDADMTRLSLLMASLASSPALATRFISLVRENAAGDDFTGIINALDAHILQASAGQDSPNLSTLRKAVESLVAEGDSEPSRMAGRLLASALENRR